MLPDQDPWPRAQPDIAAQANHSWYTKLLETHVERVNVRQYKQENRPPQQARRPVGQWRMADRLITTVAGIAVGAALFVAAIALLVARAVIIGTIARAAVVGGAAVVIVTRTRTIGIGVAGCCDRRARADGAGNGRAGEGRAAPAMPVAAACERG